MFVLSIQITLFVDSKVLCRCRGKRCILSKIYLFDYHRRLFTLDSYYIDSKVRFITVLNTLVIFILDIPDLCI